MDLWVEKYRPQTLEEMVSSKTNLEKFKQYIADKSIPHLLFTGSAGLGKCVDYDTEIDIFVDNKVYEIVKKYEIK